MHSIYGWNGATKLPSSLPSGRWLPSALHESLDRSNGASELSRPERPTWRSDYENVEQVQQQPAADRDEYVFHTKIPEHPATTAKSKA
jgi:hypothetical protein